MALPFIRIYIGDVKKDTDLLSPAAFGGYMRLLMFAMHEAPNRGEVNFTLPQLCRVFGAATLPEAEAILREIVDPQFNIVDYAEADNKHTLRNRRMIRETKVSQARSEAGKKGAESTNRRFAEPVADEFAAAKTRQTENFAGSLPDANSGAESSFLANEGVITGNFAENNQKSGFAAANDTANDPTKTRQKCNSNNSNNHINSNNEEEGVKGEEETFRPQGPTIDRGTAVLIVPELKSVFMRLRPTYPFDPVKDSGPLRLIGEAIGKAETVSAYDLPGIDQIKQTFEAIITYTLTHKLYKSFQLSQIEKYFQTICENFRNEARQGTTEVAQNGNQGAKASIVGNNLQTAQKAVEMIRNRNANKA